MVSRSHGDCLESERATRVGSCQAKLQHRVEQEGVGLQISLEALQFEIGRFGRRPGTSVSIIF